MSKAFFAALKERRTYYAISKKSNLPDEEIQKILEEAVQYTPSAYNSQSARTVLLLGGHHDKLWSIVKEALRSIVPAGRFASTEAKIDAFAAGYGTVLFLDDAGIVKDLQGQFPTYKDNFPVWAQQANGMLQLVVWTALEAEGFGASLQHYNPLIDEEVKRQWGLPEGWQLIAQMPFGLPAEGPGEKDFVPVSERTRVFR